MSSETFEEYDPTKGFDSNSGNNNEEETESDTAEKNENTDDQQNIQNRTVIVKNLPLDCTEREIFLFFRNCNGYERSYFKIDGRNKVSLAIFVSRGFAKLAVESNRIAVFDKTLNQEVTVELLIHSNSPPPDSSETDTILGFKRKRDETGEEDPYLKALNSKKQKIDHSSSGPSVPTIYTIPKPATSSPPPPQPTSTNMSYNPYYNTVNKPPPAYGSHQHVVAPPAYSNPIMNQPQPQVQPQHQPFYGQPYGGYNQVESTYPQTSFRGGFRGGMRARRGRPRGGTTKRLSTDKTPIGTLWVGNIPYGETNEALASHVVGLGCDGLRQVKIMTNGSGIGFLMFDSVDQATKARAILHDSYYKGTRFKVDYARREMKKMESNAY